MLSLGIESVLDKDKCLNLYRCKEDFDLTGSGTIVLSPVANQLGRLHQGEPERAESLAASVAFHQRCDQKTDC